MKVFDAVIEYKDGEKLSTKMAIGCYDEANPLHQELDESIYFWFDDAEQIKHFKTFGAEDWRIVEHDEPRGVTK